MAKEILNAFFTFIFEIAKVISIVIESALQLPTTPYGLVKFIADKNVIILNNQTLTMAVLYIVPLIVSHIVGHLMIPQSRFGWKVKELISILLYIFILYLFSSLIFWITIISIVVIGSIVTIIYKKRTI